MKAWWRFYDLPTLVKKSDAALLLFHAAVLDIETNGCIKR